MQHNALNSEQKSASLREGYVHVVDGTALVFRRKPYDIQVQLVRTMRLSIQKNEVGIFESPTGTGKSMSLVSTVLSWLRDVRLGRVQYKPEESAPKTAVPSFVAAWKQKNSNAQRIQCMEAVQQHKKIKPGAHSHIRSPSAADEAAGGDFSHSDCVIPRVIVASRTHSQLSQLVTEFKEFPHDGEAGPVLVLPLAARKHTCLNTSVQQKAQGDSDRLNELCTSLGADCPYREDAKVDALAAAMANCATQAGGSTRRTWALKDIEELGEVSSACPYYASRRSVGRASVILVPYNFLLDARTRAECGIDLADSVVIFDEAHNLIPTCQGMLTQAMSLQDLSSLRDHLASFLRVSSQKILPESRRKLEEIGRICEKVERAIAGTSTKFLKKSDEACTAAYSLRSFQSTFALLEANYFDLCAFIDEHVHRYARVWPFPIKKGVDSLHRFMRRMAEDEDDTAVFIDEASVRICSLRAEKVMRPILKKSLSVILLGGTMQPQAYLAKQMLGDVDRGVSRVAYPHVVPPAHVLVDCWPASPSGIRFHFTHAAQARIEAERFEGSMLGGVAQVLANVSNIVRGGVVVFYPSYAFLKLAIDAFLKNCVLESLARKGVKYFYEEKHSDTGELLKAYRAAVDSTPKSTLLFAVLGGRLSEGINFSDTYGRLVCLVGLPYPNPFDVENDVRMQFSHTADIDAICAKSLAVPPAAKRGYYDAMCMTVVSQAIGRVIRHIGDYAAIIFLDERMQQGHLRSMLPLWVQGRFQTPHSAFDSISGLGNLRKFYAERAKAQGSNT